MCRRVIIAVMNVRLGYDFVVFDIENFLKVTIILIILNICVCLSVSLIFIGLKLC